MLYDTKSKCIGERQGARKTFSCHVIVGKLDLRNWDYCYKAAQNVVFVLRQPKTISDKSLRIHRKYCKCNNVFRSYLRYKNIILISVLTIKLVFKHAMKTENIRIYKYDNIGLYVYNNGHFIKWSNRSLFFI